MKKGFKKRMNKQQQQQSHSKRRTNNIKSQYGGSSSKTLRHKLGSHSISLPGFFQRNFAIKSPNVNNNISPKLKTTHKSYYPTQARVIVIGDIHGDLDKLIDCLILSKCVKLPGTLPAQAQRTNQAMYDFFNGIEWVGGSTFIIQLGDQIDRIRPTGFDHNNIAVNEAFQDEGSSLHIMYLLWYLNVLAHTHGGRVISIMGNHEFMNVEGDFRYVSPHEFKEYYDAFHRYYDGTLKLDTEDHELVESIKKETSTMVNIPPGYMERRVAFQPSGLIANFLGLHYKLCVQVGRWIFVHAGITPSLCQNSICSVNNSISRHLIQGNQSATSQHYNNQEPNDARIYEKLINGKDENASPVWNRDFGADIDASRDEKLLSGKYGMLIRDYNKVNAEYHKLNSIPAAEYLAIGHSPQFWSGKSINSICNGKVWRCDVGMSRAFLDETEANNAESLDVRKPVILEILNDTDIRVISA